jgi:hypothetical protein
MTWWQNLLMQIALAGIQFFNLKFGGTQKAPIAIGAGAASVTLAHVAKRSDPTT